MITATRRDGVKAYGASTNRRHDRDTSGGFPKPKVRLRWEDRIGNEPKVASKPRRLKGEAAIRQAAWIARNQTVVFAPAD